MTGKYSLEEISEVFMQALRFLFSVNASLAIWTAFLMQQQN